MEKLEITETSKPYLPIQITLNGYLINDADDMVRKFKYERENDDTSKTNIWFSKDSLHHIYLLLKQENADGIRIYFARDNDGNNNVVVVSTRDGGHNPDYPKDPQKRIHLDYFEHIDPFLSDIQNSGDIIIDYGSTNIGACLYNPSSPCGDNPKNVFFSGHDVKCDDAYNWVKNYSLAVFDNSNTISEWFEIEFIKSLDDELHKASGANAPDGVRIYFGRRDTDDRIAFIIVTTKDKGGIHEDYYGVYNFDKYRLTDDNGEQCPPNCRGKLLGG